MQQSQEQQKALALPSLPQGILLFASGSPNVAPKTVAPASPGNLTEKHIPGPTPDLLHQRFWGVVQSPVLQVIWMHAQV